MYARRRALPTRPAVPRWKWLLPLFAALLAVAWAYYALAQPRNPPVQADATRHTPSQDWQTFRAFGPRPVGSPGHDQAAKWLEQQLTDLGYRVTEQPVSLKRPFDQGGTLKAGGVSIPVQALYGSLGGEQQGRLIRVPPQATTDELRAMHLSAQIALTTCPPGRWSDLVGNVVAAGAFGLVIVDDCPVHPLPKVSQTPLPLVKVNRQDGARMLALVGQTVTLTSHVAMRDVRGMNLIAARVNAKPEVLLGAHLDTVNGTIGANDNSSGVLAVVQAARQAAETPLADRAWFVLFDAEEDGLYGSRQFVQEHRYALRDTRAMLNFDMVGVAAQPLGVAAHAELLPLARQVDPALRVFQDVPVSKRETFGRSLNLTGMSDHASFKVWGVRTVALDRGLDANDHAPSDQTLNPALVEQASAFGLNLAQVVLDAPWTPKKPCGITGRNCPP